MRGGSRGMSRDPLVAIYDGYCCWPGCQRSTKETESPLCGRHLIKAHNRFMEVYGWVITEQPERSRAHLSERPGFVYFLRFSDRVKIGYTTNLVQRMTAIPHDELLHVEPGTFQKEKGLHHLFAHLRESGEWFRAEEDLMTFIAERKAAI